MMSKNLPTQNASGSSRSLIRLFLCTMIMLLAGCEWFKESQSPTPRLSMFIGVDVSGSFTQSAYYDDAIDFLAHYIYAHLNGFGKLEIPRELFIGAIGGATTHEPKTFYPKHVFENKSILEITEQLKTFFPKSTANTYTDYNAFFKQISLTVKNRNLILRPISVVMVSDGKPDVKTAEAETNFRSIQVKPLEKLTRNITIRLLYPNAVVANKWQQEVRRKRVKLWTQDANVMIGWKDPKILVPTLPIEKQDKFFIWLADNVDFGVRSRRVN